MAAARKVLILRFSSFGDVLQSLSVAGKIKSQWPDSEIHFCTRSDFVPLVENHPEIFQVWQLNKSDGFLGLMDLAFRLKKISFTHIYDCHNNLRSRILSWCLNGPFQIRRILKGHRFLRRPIYRWKRFLLFTFRKNLFPQPFSGQKALLEPLKKWGMDDSLPTTPQLFFDAQVESVTLQNHQAEIQGAIALAPSAAFALKRWPLDHFKKLIELMPQNRFVVLGGPDDTFTQELEDLYPERVKNLAGKLSLMQSSVLVAHSRLLVSNDTGLMHVAEQAGTRCVALMGPAPFGFPSREKTKIMELALDCRPCSKHGQGPCVNKVRYQQCLVDITPEQVADEIIKMESSNV